MQLQYLEFDFSDEESGRGSFDAMASVGPSRIPAVLAEMGTVLEWAHDLFGASAAQGSAGADGDEAEWDYELQAVADDGSAIAIVYRRLPDGRGQVVIESGERDTRTTLTLTLSGSEAFCSAFREEFSQDE